jgi:hypothetical protein
MATFLGSYKTKSDYAKYKIVRISKATGKERNVYSNLTYDEAEYIAARLKSSAKTMLVIKQQRR